MSFFRCRCIMLIALLIASGGCGIIGGKDQESRNSPRPATQRQSPPDQVAPAPVTLFERLGGAEGIGAVVEDLISLSLTDPRVNFPRTGHARTWNPSPEALALLKRRLVDFISVSAGGDANYTGQDLRTAHQGMGIRGDEFDAFLANLQKAMEKNEVEESTQVELLAIFRTTRSVIVEEAPAPSSPPPPPPATPADEDLPE